MNVGKHIPNTSCPDPFIYITQIQIFKLAPGKLECDRGCIQILSNVTTLYLLMSCAIYQLYKSAERQCI